MAALYPVLAIAALLGLWEAVIRIFDVPVWLVPKPSDFLGRFFTEFPALASAAWATSVRIFFGFALGILVAVPLGLAIVSIPALERGLYPVIVFLNIMPKTVIGPILIVWFGIGPLVAVLIVFLMSFFPVLVDSMSGFRAVDPRLRYITRSMGASPLQTFFYIRLPASMPHIYAGMRIGIIKAVEGVIIAEFIASNAGLGHLIMRASSYMDMPLMFCGLIATAIVALIFNGIVTLVGRLLMPWARRR
ncbi:ABC transporter permease [Acuticoccus kandeliae]|uniref:ABC transporter permease n=1 Tax=Acuticoccus kandeliae TaxID=2073160 RepID=UPI0013001900|nr:ABC transporter permease [Acuticoccus kandeliae]